MALVALLSNPRSTGNKSLLPEVRRFCAEHGEIFHYEVEEVSQIEAARVSIARVRPKVLVINGGDGTVQAALTELYQSSHFEGAPPPIAVLPNGKTNLIALDLGSSGDPIVALASILEIARGNMTPWLVERQMIALSDGGDAAVGRPVLGMFLGGAGLADYILYCRNKIYPLGLPNGVSHLLAAIAGLLSLVFKGGSLLPRRPQPMRVTLRREGEMQGSFAVLIVTTLDRLLLGGAIKQWVSGSESNMAGAESGRVRLRLLAIDKSPRVMARMALAMLRGRVGRDALIGVHLLSGDEICIESDSSSVILDGEVFETRHNHPIVLRSTPPVSFLKLAA